MNVLTYMMTWGGPESTRKIILPPVVVIKPEVQEMTKVQKGDSRSRSYKGKVPLTKTVTPQACGRGSGSKEAGNKPVKGTKKG
jgi:hypothetical protein